MTTLYWENEGVEVFSVLMEESASWFWWWLYGTVHMIKVLTCCRKNWWNWKKVCSLVYSIVWMSISWLLKCTYFYLKCYHWGSWMKEELNTKVSSIHWHIILWVKLFQNIKFKKFILFYLFHHTKKAYVFQKPLFPSKETWTSFHKNSFKHYIHPLIV